MVKEWRSKILFVCFSFKFHLKICKIIIDSLFVFLFLFILKSLSIESRHQLSYEDDLAVLIINDVQLDDSGEYICKANNDEGSDTSSAQLVVKAKVSEVVDEVPVASSTPEDQQPVINETPVTATEPQIIQVEEKLSSAPVEPEVVPAPVTSEPVVAPKTEPEVPPQPEPTKAVAAKKPLGAAALKKPADDKTKKPTVVEKKKVGEMNKFISINRDEEY